MTGKTQTTNKDGQEWDQAADWAQQGVNCAGEVATCASEAIGHVASAVGATASRKVDELAEAAGAQIQNLSEKISQNAPEGGILGSATRQVAQTVRKGGEYLEDRKLSGLTDEISTIIRSNPISAVVIAFAMGWMMARKR